MKKLLLTLLIVALFLSNGCAYRDMNRLKFVTMSIFDRNELGEIELYHELFSSTRGQGQDLGVAKRVTGYARGETIGDAYYIGQSNTSLPAAYDVNKTVVFTENIAKHGLIDIIGAFGRNQKPTLKQYLFISEGQPTELLGAKVQDEEYIGIYLEQMMIFQEHQARVISILLNDYLNDRLRGSRVAIVPTVRRVVYKTGEDVEISGAAVLVNDKMVEKLTLNEVATYKFLTGEIKLGDITVDNPQDKGKLVSLLVLKNKTKDDFEYHGESLIYTIEINTVCSIESVQGKIDVTDDKVVDQIKKQAEEDIKKRGIELFEKYQEQGIDLFNVELQLERKDPNAELQDVLKNTTLNLDVTVKIDGSQTTSNSR
ncbi:Ger(x)C family spore germination protein [Alkalibaculum sp. M08DMB]|uniref:Ger(X)C family spore germination protein n=1 Tax=Alkalibaculum sporogenes TaxID=2655001 RepID=A0A6A7KB71_9FIRM|nr:Ger(x)C family spore germination protein [Alkalibaculum sporogenes]MPW26654.1 Ger(x)C family spore germination protein [Alkalibaculum sporogenes]